MCERPANAHNGKFSVHWLQLTLIFISGVSISIAQISVTSLVTTIEKPQQVFLMLGYFSDGRRGLGVYYSFRISRSLSNRAGLTDA